MNFPGLTNKGYFDRPEVWEEQINRLGNRIRPFHRYNKEFHGHSPKPNWNITQRPTGARSGRYAGAAAKVVWKPPGKTQRVSARSITLFPPRAINISQKLEFV